MSTSAAEGSKDLLLAEYEHRFEEVIFHSTRYHKQTDFVHLFATVLVGIGALLLTNQVPPALGNRPTEDLAIFFLLLLVVALILELYLFSTLMESLFMIYLNGSRIAAIEEQLNKFVDSKILVWDSVVIPYFFSPRLLYSRGWIKPHYLVGLWSFLLFGSILAILTCICFFIAPQAFPYYFIAVVVFGVVHIQQWLALLTTGAKLTYAHVQSLSNLDTDGTSPLLARGSRQSGASLEPEHWFAAMTFIFGSAVFIASSLATDSFDFSSSVSFPLLAIPSVAVGDTFLIPLFTFYVFRFFRRTGAHSQFSRRFLVSLLFVAFLAASAFHWQLHRSWAADPYSGFMDRAPDELSFAGWWHFAFSSAVTTLILLFLAAWFRALEARDRDGFALGLKAWAVLVAFSSLSVVDFVVRHVLVFHTQSWIDALRRDWISLLPPLIVSAVWIVAYAASRRRFSKMRPAVVSKSR